MSTESALGPYRALDLTDENGFLCGKILGDLGADVIKIERPGGDPSRRIGPFYKNDPDPEKSLSWFAFNANKRGMTLNLDNIEGKEIFTKLVQKADFVIESFAPGYMDGLGLGYSELSKINPSLIMTSITHFGQDGPYRDYKGGDLVDTATSGYMFLCGDRDRPPVRISFPQASLHASADAAAASMIAFHHRQMTGEGQHVDVSVQQSMVRILYVARMLWDFNGDLMHRKGNVSERRGAAGPTTRPQTWHCKDGAISFLMTSGPAGAKNNTALVKWMKEEGMADDFLTSIDWEKVDAERLTQETVDRISEQQAKFFMSHTAAELYQGAKERRIMLYPVSTSKDVAQNRQLAARGFWEPVWHPELNTSITYPSAFLKSSEMPLKVRRRAPPTGEHTEEILREIGVSREDMAALERTHVI